MAKPKGRKNAKLPSQDEYLAAYKRVRAHPLFGHLEFFCTLNRRQDDTTVPSGQWAMVGNDHHINFSPTKRASEEEWFYVMAHCLLHLGLGHLRQRSHPAVWNLACDLQADRFLASLGVKNAPLEYRWDLDWPSSDLERCYEELQGHELLDGYVGDLDPGRRVYRRMAKGFSWADELNRGLQKAVRSALTSRHPDLVAGEGESPIPPEIQKAREWFINRYPLMGAMAASFRLICDPELCRREDIQVAAVNSSAKEMYFNPVVGLTPGEWRFVMAHEMLHAGLRHQQRTEGRDPYIWNVSCDYMINQWLVEMGVGQMPQGLLYDPQLKGLSAEDVYDRICGDLRRLRKLSTLAGRGVSDIRGQDNGWWLRGRGMDLDDFYRSVLAEGLSFHEQTGRGYLPAGLVEEIYAQSQPPIPWDVELAQWLDDRIPTEERTRTYARVSRRQSATPDIPRPGVAAPDEQQDRSRTFGVVLDTSGSMDRHLLANALGAVASYAESRSVRLVRVVFCDAVAYDEGWISPTQLADRLRVKGRGGTVLQPGIDLLQSDEDFPAAGPILIITDTECDHVQVKRDHAYLVPKGKRLPFSPRGPVFGLKL